MVKLNLSAMQNNTADTANITENNDSIKQNSSQENKSEVLKVAPIQKKKVSLDSLISGKTDEGNMKKATEKLVVSELVELKETETENSKITINNESELTKKTKIKLDLSSAGEISVSTPIVEDINFPLETKDDTKVIEDVLEKKEKTNIIIETNTENFSEDKSENINLVNISDGDTIGKLIVDSNKDELFTGYVSSFEKEIQSLKKKKEKNIHKLEDNKNTTFLVEEKKEELDLDKIIEEVKIKEEISINEGQINNLDVINTKTNKNRNYFKFSFLVFAVLAIVASGVFYYLDLSKNIDSNNIKTNLSENHSLNLENTNNNEKKSIQDSSALDFEKIEENINKTYKDEEVKQKLIKYFKNKQNNVKIDSNKN